MFYLWTMDTMREGAQMAIVAWRLIGLQFDGRPDGAYWVARENTVCDVDVLGWKRGVRPGMSCAEAAWRYSEGEMVPWHAEIFREVLENLRDWLCEHTERFELSGPWLGWGEWPRLQLETFSQMMDEIIPDWVLGVKAGVASQRLLAKAALSEGERWNLPLWTGKGLQAHVMPPAQEAAWWPEIPLNVVESEAKTGGISHQQRQQWGIRGWTTVGQVPGLSERLKQEGIPVGCEEVEKAIQESYRWEQEPEGGFAEVLTELATRLTQALQKQAMGFRRLDVTWSGAWGTVRHRREWPIATGEARAVLLRVLDCLKQVRALPGSPESIEIRLRDLSPWGTEQLQWGFSSPRRDLSKKQGTEWRLGSERRELVLQFWDPWRFPSHEFSPQPGRRLRLTH
jgi:hypothetical protein